MDLAQFVHRYSNTMDIEENETYHVYFNGDDIDHVKNWDSRPWAGAKLVWISS